MPEEKAGPNQQSGEEQQMPLPAAQIIPVNIENLYHFILRETPEAKHEVADIYKESRQLINMIIQDGLRRIVDPKTGDGLVIAEFETMMGAKAHAVHQKLRDAIETIRDGNLSEGIEKLSKALDEARRTMLVLAATYAGLARLIYLNLPPSMRPAMGKIPLGYETL